MAWGLYPEGLPLGAITHIEGQGRTEALLQLLAQHPGMKAAWVEERLSAYPPGFVQRGVNLNLLLFVQGGEQFHWALTQLVRSQVFPLVAVASPLKGELEMKRLQLAAEKSGTVVLALADIEGPAWPIKLWLETSTEGGKLRLVPAKRSERLQGLG